MVNLMPFFMKTFLYAIMFVLLSCTEGGEKLDQKNEKLKVLILTGKNNHEWKLTTPQLLKMYNESGRFTAESTERPDTLGYHIFKTFDAVVSNFTAWPEHSYRWPDSTEHGLMKFIEEGGGFVLFHAASAAFYDWDEYQKLIGSTWGDSTRHGKRVPHKIEITDRNHPVTKGMKDFWITDELWVNTKKQPGIKVLATSVSDPANKGRGLPEPVILYSTKGKGRCFHNVLGHNVRAMRNTGWTALMLRGTEWAATGKVTIPLPQELQFVKNVDSEKYSWEKTDTTFALVRGDDIVWQYNFNTIKGKPFFHPLKAGTSDITSVSPDDHPWHLGLWFSWKYINGVNYWEYERGKNVKPWNFRGETEVKDISFEKGRDHSCNITLEIAYHEKGGPDLLHETRKLYVSKPDDSGKYFIDYDMTFVATADTVILDRTPLPGEKHGKSYGGYAGLSVRFNQDYWSPHFIDPAGVDEDKLHGRSMPWLYFGFKTLTGENAGAAIFDHPGNLNYPTPWFIVNSSKEPFYYISPAVIFKAPHVMHNGDTLRLRYRVMLYPGEVTKENLLDDQKNYINN